MNISSMVDFAEDEFKRMEEICLKRNPEVPYKESKTKKMYDKIIRFSELKNFINDIEGKNCTLFELEQSLENKYSELQIKRICHAAKAALYCRAEYQGRSKSKITQEPQSPGNLIDTPKKTPSVFAE